MIQGAAEAGGGVVVPGVHDCPVLRLMGTAYHEAAHGVAAGAMWSAITVTSATIIPDDTSLGRVTFEEPDELLLGTDRDERVAAARAAEADAVFCLAGYVAEGLFYGHHDLPDFVLRTQDFHDLVQTTAVTWDGDSTRVCHALAYQDSVRDLLEDSRVWRAVSLVASALICERTLSGEQIRAIVDAVGVKPDPERQPFLFFEDDLDDDDEAFSWERW